MTLLNFKSDLEAVKYMIENSGESSWSLEKSTGISRQTIDRWMKADHLKIRRATLSDFASKLNYQVQYNKDGTSVSPHTKKQESGDLNMEQQNMLIELQAEKIKRLEDRLSNEASPHECSIDNVYGIDQAEIIFNFDVKIKWSLKKPGILVRYNDDADKYVPKMANKLGYTELEMAELLQIGEMIEYKDHNIHKLRTAEQKNEMLGIINNFMSAFNKVKLNTSLLIAEIPVKYTSKQGVIYAANVEYRVNWIRGKGTAHIRWLKD
jgi:hypothetical protein